ncbi:glycoside hydrolase family 76 protein [Corynebacterium bovis]|uniref:Glycoside hydrolase family 76 n=3 Tax=Corynebacterium bovis TaxID=36808 RepID=A0A3R8QSB0_9CORY|nr:glycoside hydrolase family 76 protein [Corynebacterium bovis]MBB3115551.1 putative alpha-1,6-mannanase (GH76 family) [Corynebacterium bovis DSM 20582 = CIP 54.80]MBB3116744.1 putative alpha-1,6-mannanase (GH76 family) [Corynebacterium bovis DSM 20582 = CIP 54.80]MDH2456408.1 glycoside hydrolase family 76 protein [Corynebacterium bovis]QQC46704.1 glycoside hydrolase family 76 [Corynebacterium bovis]RRO80373.1 glycoside hydrolase family 76 [Corynebacterium bovis]
MQERWDHRADLAEQAVAERHAARLWGIPRTNLAVIAWPPTSRDKIFFRWHYWWQAHYIDCQVDAAQRRSTRLRLGQIRRTIRGMRLRNFGRLTANNYYDDKAWLALALERTENLRKYGTVRYRDALEENILDGIDPLTGVLPWRSNETFYNVPTNGPAAILAARTGRLDVARRLTDWVFETLINDDGLVLDGLRMRMHGPEQETAVHPYCQGVMIGACVEIARAMREEAGVGPDEVSPVGVEYITRAQGLVRAVARSMATRDNVIDWRTGGGDGGLFKGILARYLALAAVALPGEDRSTRETRRLAGQLVTASAGSVWMHRLEVDGLPVFPSDWTADAVLPQSGGLVGATIAGAVGSSDIAERDLSVQLSGWMLMEAAAQVAAAEDDARTR